MNKEPLTQQLRLDLEGDSDYDLDNENDNRSTSAQVLDAMGVLTAAILPLDDRLWTLSHVAAYIGVSEDTARRAMNPSFGAPMPIRLPTRKGSYIPHRWVASEVKAYAERQKRMRRKVPTRA